MDSQVIGGAADDEPGVRDTLLLAGAVDMLVHAGPQGVGGSLVHRLLGAPPPARTTTAPPRQVSP